MGFWVIHLKSRFVLFLYITAFLLMLAIMFFLMWSVVPPKDLTLIGRLNENDRSYSTQTTRLYSERANSERQFISMIGCSSDKDFV